LKKDIRVGIFPNLEIKKVREALLEAMGLCRELGIRTFMDKDLAKEYGATAYEEVATEIDAAFSLGGDGTFLRMARRMAVYDIPVFGVNFGHLGFLADVEHDEMKEALQNLAARKFTIQKRPILTAQIFQGEKVAKESLAINEFVLGRGQLTVLSHMEIHINGKFSGRYDADGIIVSTATGSTAYSLSAGGPLVQPSLDVMLITPVCAHAFAARPLIIPSSEQVDIFLVPPTEKMEFSADGSHLGIVKKSGSVHITKSKKELRLIKLNDRSYYETWQEKLIKSI